jgi:hypothetical protein
MQSDSFKTFDIQKECGYNMGMKLFKFYMTDNQRSFLDEVSSQSGLSVAEIIRRAIDAYSSERPYEEPLEVRQARVNAAIKKLEAKSRV